MKKIYLDGNSLTLKQLELVAKHEAEVKLTKESKMRVIKCRNFVEKIIKERQTVYGLTTGFGKFSTIRIEPEKIEELQENLIMSHATGVGPDFSEMETRAIMLLRINVLAKGYSGIRLSTLHTLIDMLNKGVHPLIPEKGSVGASGDLAPLSHLALVLLGKGKAKYKGTVMDGKEAMKKAEIKPVHLAAKEGLALNNGTQVMTAVGALNLIKAERLCDSADVITAMTVDALQATPDAFDPLIHKVRPHKGQRTSALNIHALLTNSQLRESHKNCDNVQDAYSLRCSAQVHGAVRDNLSQIRKTIETELNSATDNPLIFPDQERVISGGNFHGEPIAFACDTLGLTMSELANISERRMEQLFNPALNRDLNPFLAARPGLDSGFMIAQLTAASLISENKVLAHPASVDSIPTSANQEDHVSMGTISAVKARNIIDNVTQVLAIELMAAVQALDCREFASSTQIEVIRKKFREDIPYIEKDIVLKPFIDKAKEFILTFYINNSLDKTNL